MIQPDGPIKLSIFIVLGFSGRQLQDSDDRSRQPSKRQFRGVAEHVSVRGPRQKHQTEGETQPTQCQPSRDTIPRDYLGTEGGSDPLENATGGSGNDGE